MSLALGRAGLSVTAVRAHANGTRLLTHGYLGERPMPDRIATTRWTGALTTGSGITNLASSGAGQFTFSLPTRAGEPNGQTSPEELVAAAHSACYSMQLSALLTAAGKPPARIDH